MLHPDLKASAVSPLSASQAQAAYDRTQRAIDTSQRTPWRQMALGLGLLWYGLLALVAGLARLCGRGRPDAIDRTLAHYYFHVPEMALHKKIELQAFLRQPLQGHVVDLGCGNGIVGRTLLNHGAIASLFGVDRNAGSILAARGNGYVGGTAADLAEIPLPDAGFDHAISICVLEHLEELEAALGEAFRLIRPGGSLCFTTPAPAFREGLLGHRLLTLAGLRRHADAFAHRRDLANMHLRYLDPPQWQALLTRIGFCDVSVEPLFSRRQLLVYDVLNWCVYLPRLYTCDKVQGFFTGRPQLARVARWLTAVLTATVSRWPVFPATATHWMIRACVPPASDAPTDAVQEVL